MKLGFIGSRNGMTADQRSQLWSYLDRNRFTEFHHGACVGADDDASDIVYCQQKTTQKIIAHPPTVKTLVSQRAIDVSDEVREPFDYLIRNRHIVDSCDLLLATPAGPEEQRSGTWATIRYARKTQRPIVIFWPDGTISE